MCLTAQHSLPFSGWQSLNPIPDSVGFAGSFSGVTNDVLLVAGGANFPSNGAPWLGSRKVWYDDIFVLSSPEGDWQHAGRLPRPLGYGVSVSTGEKLIIIGGSNEDRHYADVYALSYEDYKIKIETLPALPLTLANSAGALVGTRIYVLGGLAQPDNQSTENIFLCLDLNDLKKGWVVLDPLPGPSRMLSVAASATDMFFVCSGAELIKGRRRYLKDSYGYTPQKGWERFGDLPHAVVAAPSPAYANQNGVYVLGGDDGVLATSDLRSRHPGFSTDILEFNLTHKTWSQTGKLPVVIQSNAVESPNQSTWAPVTTSMAIWRNLLILPGGEVRPATRTPRVWAATLESGVQ